MEGTGGTGSCPWGFSSSPRVSPSLSVAVTTEQDSWSSWHLGSTVEKKPACFLLIPAVPISLGAFSRFGDWRWILVQGIATCFVLSDVQGQGLSHIFAQALGVDLVPLDKTPSVWGWKSSVLGPAEGCVPTGPHPESPVADSERHSLNSPRWWPRWLLGQPPMATQTALASGVDASLNH